MLAPPRLDAASAAATTTLLNCYLREGGAAAFADGRVSFPALGVEADVAHRSQTFQHRFANVSVEVPELAARIAAALDPSTPPDALLARVTTSLDRQREYLEARADDVERLWSAEPLSFEDTEQALLLGHPLHPTPKGLCGRLARYAPELRPHFQLHWLAVDEQLVVHDSAAGTPAPELLGVEHPPGKLLIPAHPWEAGYLAREAAGLFEDLGAGGETVTPTSSVRTVYRADAPYMLKFSLHARVTNSMRVTLPKELRRAVEAARLNQLLPVEGLTVIQDPAYLSVPGHDGFSVLLRENIVGGNLSSLAALCQDHPHGGRSRAATLAGDRAREWFAAYLDVLIVPIIRAYLDLGLTYEPHQQNTLLELGDDGMPVRGLIRDSQGYFHREAAHADICGLLPAHGEASESIFPEALADERLVYYPFVNNALGVIHALGSEALLLGDLRAVLERERERGGRYPHTLLDRLLDDERWPCKANLRTRLQDMDELVGDISTQSVYLTIPNPLRA